jgi:hypothetical protein
VDKPHLVNTGKKGENIAKEININTTPPSHLPPTSNKKTSVG